jgi:autotransporter adhesin
VALGDSSEADADNSVALGAGSYTDRANTVSVGDVGSERQIANVAAGTEDTDAVNVGQLNDSVDASFRYFKANSSGTNDDAQINGLDSVAIGPRAVANGDGSIAMGSGAITYGNYGGTAIGGGDGTMTGTNIAGQLASAMGFGAQAKGVGDTAMGAYANTGDANPNDANDDSTNSYRTAVGYKASATGDASLAMGAFNQATGARSVAIGYNANASEDDSVALGSNSVADRASTVSVGSAGNERQVTNVAAGTQTTDAVNKGQLDAVAAQAGQTDAAAVKYDDAGKDQVTLGGASGTRVSNLQASNVSGDAATVGQVEDVLSAFGGGAMLQAGGAITMPTYVIQGGSYTSVGGAFGALDSALSGALFDITSLDNRVSSLEQGFASGGTTNSHVATDGASGGGDAASVAAGSKGVAVGSNATAGGDHGTAVGGDSYAAGPNDTAIGGNAKVNADGSTAVGANTTIAAAATNAVAVGESASVTAASGTAIGQGSSVTAAGAVALGQGSVADRANTVSVGTAANNRQVTNVAAGTQTTDAANLGQVQQALITAKGYADASSQQTLQSANAYTDQRLSGFASSSDVDSLRNQVNDQFHTMDKRVNQVGAMGTAMAQMALSTQGIDTANRLGVGVGGYHGEAALSVGYSRQLSPRANVVFGAAVSGNEATGGVGVGIGW